MFQNGVMLVLRSSSSAKINIDDFCGNIYIDNFDVSKHQCSNKVISNVVCSDQDFFGLLYLVLSIIETKHG